MSAEIQSTTTTTNKQQQPTIPTSNEIVDAAFSSPSTQTTTTNNNKPVIETTNNNNNPKPHPPNLSQLRTTPGGVGGSSFRIMFDLTGKVIDAISKTSFQRLHWIHSCFSGMVLIQSALICAGVYTNLLLVSPVAQGAADLYSTDSSSTISTCNNYVVYAITASIISLLASFAASMMNSESTQFRFYFSLYLFIWWTVGVIILTFISPFTTVLMPMGYFGCWGCFVTSIIGMIQDSAGFRSGLQIADNGTSRYLVFLYVCSLVVMGAGISTCVNSVSCVWTPAFAIAFGATSVILCIACSIFKTALGTNNNFFTGMFVYWLIGTSILTFYSPFWNVPGNGYFFSIGGCLTTYLLTKVTITRTIIQRDGNI
jgi:hypothetical protein